MAGAGAHPYTDITDRVKQLKREKRLDEALALLMECIEQIEKRGRGYDSLDDVAYEQAAIVLRAQKRYADEAALLERLVGRTLAQSTPVDCVWQAERLLKASQLAKLVEEREVDGRATPYHLAEQCAFAERALFIQRGLVVDVETTGLSREDELVELGAVLFTFNAYTGQVQGVEQTYSGRREPGVAISAGAQRVHGIKPAELQGCHLDDAQVKGLFAQAKVVIAHNAAFDRRFVAQIYPAEAEKPWLCTMNGIAWRSKGLKSKSLAAVVAATGVTAQQAHAGLGDSLTLLEVLKATDAATGRPYLSELLRSRPVAQDATDLPRSASPSWAAQPSAPPIYDVRPSSVVAPDQAGYAAATCARRRGAAYMPSLSRLARSRCNAAT
ncbi:MAG: DNA polymerase III subunit epsilon [Chloroflexi bacterium ADurb.Bin325]|nr:MAG: DNA polymerase III subunit epsilon [Chloroflexi bacterium ADurb.Bin325]